MTMAPRVRQSPAHEVEGDSGGDFPKKAPPTPNPGARNDRPSAHKHPRNNASITKFSNQIELNNLKTT